MGYVQRGRLREGWAMCRGEAGCCSHWVGGVAMESGAHALTGGCPEGYTCKEAYVCMRVGEGGRGLVGGRRQVSVNTEGG